MARQKRYQGEFLSISGIVWRAEIWQEAAQAYATVGDLEFDADEPVTIEWARVDKENVICGSSATLNLNSPGNGTYQDLYTIEAGSVQLRLYRNNVLYWSGTLDTEFYEEPYSSGMNYTVQLTFSDFGILDRLKYDLTGMQTLSAIVSHAVDLSGVLNGGIDTSLVSTTFSDNAAIIAAGGLAIRSDNFTDEDGEISTMQEVIEGILQPLGIRMVQRSGMIYLYDLNGLYSSAASQAVVWTEGGGMFGVDKVANNIKITFSPYSGAELFDGELEYGGKYDVEKINLTNEAPSVSSDYGEYYSYYSDYSEDSRMGTSDLIDFTIFLHASGSGLAAIGTGCKYFHLLPVLGGVSEATGVAYAFRTGGHGGIGSGLPVWKLHSVVPRPNDVLLMKTYRMYVPKLSSSDAARFRIRLLQEILIDARYNPFSDTDEDNDNDNDNLLKSRSAWVFIPAKVTLYDAAGVALYHYSNAADVTSAQTGNIRSTTGSWVAGAAQAGDCYLEYYNPDDLAEDAGIRGWKGNRHAIGRPDGFNPVVPIVLGVPSRMEPKMYESFKKMEDGEYMPYPPSGGYLEVVIQAGLYGYAFKEGCAFGSEQSLWDRVNDNLYAKLRWCLYKAPQLSIVRNNLVLDDAEMEDVEYSGTINVAAREEMEIDTVCGTASQVCPTARGIYHRASTGEQVSALRRAGRTDHPEKLLIGTLYSQYAGRKLVLTGVAAIDGGLHRYTEYNQGDMRMMLMSDVQDLRMDTTEAEYCEIRPDEYDERTSNQE